MVVLILDPGTGKPEWSLVWLTKNITDGIWQIFPVSTF